MDDETERELLKTLGRVERKINGIGDVVNAAAMIAFGWFVYHLATRSGAGESTALLVGASAGLVFGYALGSAFNKS